MQILKFVSLALILMMFSCKDEERIITIQGKVSDPVLAIDLSQVEVKIYTKQAGNGTVSNVFVYQQTEITGDDGLFKFEIPFKYTIAYKLEFSKQDYFETNSEIHSEEINSDDTYFEEVSLLPKGTLNIHLKNSFPFNENDLINYRIVDWSYSCDGCCPSGFHEFQGMDVDETINCLVIGGSEYTVEYIVFKNGNSNASHRIVFCNPFQVTDVNISY